MSKPEDVWLAAQKSTHARIGTCEAMKRSNAREREKLALADEAIDRELTQLWARVAALDATYELAQTLTAPTTPTETPS